MRIAAIVPMRHESERVPGKNYRILGDKPLYHHIVGTLLTCTLIDKVVIDTDSQFIMSDAASRFPEVKILHRPPHLRDGAISMNDVLLNDIEQIDSDLYVQTHSTNPLLRTETISGAIAGYLNNKDDYDSLFSVTRMRARLWDNKGMAINHNPAILLRTQDLRPIYIENSCLYIFSKDVFKNRRNRIGKRPLMWEIDQIEAWDIDEESDFQITEFLYKRKLLKDSP